MKINKKIITSALVLISGMAFSQVNLSGPNGIKPANKKEAVLLEFEAGQNKGIILPYTRVLPSGNGLVAGTMVLDVSDATKAKVKYYAPGNTSADKNGWIDLSSGNEANLITPIDYMEKQPLSTGVNAVVEDPNGKVIIGSETSTANGVLVLESTTRTMILPIVTSTDDVKDPAPGMMVYLNETNKRLAVFNGAKWTYWAP